MDASWIFEPSKLRETLHSLNYPEEAVEPIVEAAVKLAGDPEAQAEFLKLQDDWLHERQNGTEEPERMIWNALAIISAFPAMFAEHQRRQIPWEVTVATAWDIPRRMLHFRRVFGFWGCDVQRWMRAHVNSRLVQIGRLQYGRGKYHYPANVYRTGSATVAMARPGIPCGEDNWPVAPDQQEEVWTTTLEQEGDQLVGHRVTPRGALEREKSAIPADSPCLLEEECDVLHVHIPMGEKLDPEICRKSLGKALPFFERHFPETRWAAICCGSWLLDRALGDFLPPTSNVVAFGQLFTALPRLQSRDGSHYRWVFGVGTDHEKAMALPEKNTFQRGLLDYVNAGGILRNTGGYIVRG